MRVSNGVLVFSGEDGRDRASPSRRDRDLNPFNSQLSGRDDFMQMLRFVLTHVGGDVDVSNMDYDQLLQRFGSGNSTRAADHQTIDALPTHTVVETQDDPERNNNKETCNICLCDYEIGDCCKKLPCNHVYHTQCIDRWLRNVSSCPVCKAPITPTHP